MSLHPPKHITSKEGLGLHTIKSIEFIDSNKAIGREVWGDLDEPWMESGTIIAKSGYTWLTAWEQGRPYIVTKFLNETDELVGVYCDICHPVERVEESFALTDLYVDVWMARGQEPVLLDEDELEQATKAGFISRADADQAKRVALLIIDMLKNKADEFLNFG